jgi:hypothetical protein
MQILAVDKPDVPPLEMPARFRMEIVYFMTCPAAAKAEIPLTDEHEAWLQWLITNEVRHVRLV